MVYTGPVIKRTDSSRGTRWLKRAESLARRITQPYATTREIHDGYLVEGRRAGGIRVAQVIDPPGQVVIAGRTPFEVVDDEGVPGVVVRNEAGFSYRRDALHPDNTPGEASQLAPPVGTYRRFGATLFVRDPDEAYAVEPNGAFTHEVFPLPDGRRGVGYTYAKPVPSPEGDVISYYRPRGGDVFFRFEFYVVGGMATDPPVGDVPPHKPWLGLSLDTEWVEQYLGGGARLVLDATVDAFGNTKPPLFSWGGMPMFYDSRGGRWAMPWVVAQPISTTPTSTTWRVLTRYGEPPLSTYDGWGKWMLATFDVHVEMVDGELVVSPGGVVRYDPFDSGDASRITAFDFSEHAAMQVNMYGFPVGAPGGAFLVSHIASPDPASNPAITTDTYYSFNAVLLTPERQFIEVSGLPADVSWEMNSTRPCYGKLRSLFFGGDTSGGRTVFINPFVSPGILAEVDATTGEVELVPRDTLVIPLAIALAPGQHQNRMYYTDDICKGLVAAIGEGLLAFPVCTTSTAEGSNLCLAVYDLVEKTVEVRGEATDLLTFANGSGGVSKPGAVQYELHRIDAPTVPGVILWGFRAPIADREGTTLLSLDSGWTWEVLSDTYGPARGIWYAGNALSITPPGTLWYSK